MEAARDHGAAPSGGPAALTTDVSDARLVARCRGGDDGDAWRELVERFSRYVYAIVRAKDEIVRSSQAVTSGDAVDVELAEGGFGARVEDTR